MERRTVGIFKGIIWRELESYLSHPACDLDGNLLYLHAGRRIGEDFTSYSGRDDGEPGKYSTCKLNPKLIKRLNVTNAFAQCRDKGIISESEYSFVKDFLTRKPNLRKKYRINMYTLEHHYVRILRIATEAMIPILYPRQWAIVEESKEAVRV